jgi:hypothetical protein
MVGSQCFAETESHRCQDEIKVSKNDTQVWNQGSQNCSGSTRNR